MNMRKHYNIEMTNEFTATATPHWGTSQPFRGTPRQCVAEYNEFNGISGGSDTAVRGVGIDWHDLLDAVNLAELDREWAKQIASERWK